MSRSSRTSTARDRLSRSLIWRASQELCNALNLILEPVLWQIEERARLCADGSILIWHFARFMRGRELLYNYGGTAKSAGVGLETDLSELTGCQAMVPDALPDDPILTAEVLFFTDKGARLPPTLGQITPENLASFEPSPAAMDNARKVFEKLGFDVLAGSFSLTISGPTSLFEQTFEVTIGEPAESIELAVPERLEGIVDAIILNEPYELY